VSYGLVIARVPSSYHTDITFSIAVLSEGQSASQNPIGVDNETQVALTAVEVFPREREKIRPQRQDTRTFSAALLRENSNVEFCWWCWYDFSHKKTLPLPKKTILRTSVPSWEESWPLFS
jgi:hypothetical protein